MENEITGITEARELPENTHLKVIFRLKAFILLLIVLIPIILALYELVSIQLTAQTLQTIHPHLPQLSKVITF